MKINAVVAAGRFSDAGQLIDVRGQLKPDIAQAAAQFCGTANMLF
jgi:roadblock/LC7 domain-containing protein